jgi:hypothetical protein
VRRLELPVQLSIARHSPSTWLTPFDVRLEYDEIAVDTSLASWAEARRRNLVDLGSFGGDELWGRTGNRISTLISRRQQDGTRTLPVDDRKAVEVTVHVDAMVVERIKRAEDAGVRAVAASGCRRLCRHSDRMSDNQTVSERRED